MPPVFQAHYANRLGREDVVRASGRMRIRQGWPMRPFAFLLRWTKTLVPVTADAVSTQVTFRTHRGERAFWYDRRFALRDGRRMTFLSRMEPRGEQEAVEWTTAGLGWHARFSYEGGRVRLRHLGYRIRLGTLDLPLPATWLLGKPSAWEEALSDSAFRMEMTIDHPLFGRLYSYAGDFRIDEVALEQ